MTVGTLPGVQGLLEPAIALYGWRLNRAFGPKRVGWCLVAAFVCLAIVHLLSPTQPASALPSFAPILIGFLLLLAMAHTEFFLGSTLAISTEQTALRTRLKSETEEREKLAEAHQKLVSELTSLREQHESLVGSERQYRFLFSNSPLPMWIYDLRSYRFLALNDAALKLLGYNREDLMLLTALDIRPPGEVPAFRKHSELSNPPFRSQIVWRHCTRDKQTLHGHVHCLDLKFNDLPGRLVYIEDVTPARLRETEARHAVRMEAASDVAASVAHHFNDALTPVLGYTTSLRNRVGNPELTSQLRQISDAATRMGNLTSQLMVFGRGKAPELALLDLNTVLQDSSSMLRRLLGSSFQLEFDCDPRLPIFSADSEMLTRVLVNLVLNGRDAMPEGGNIIVTTGSTAPSGATAETPPSVFFTVEDAGCGIPSEIRPRIFEPFFTTHSAGTHTGIGLALAYAIVKQHHGAIDFKSEPGVGSTFKVTIPCTPPSSPG